MQSIAAGLCVTISQQVQNGLGRDANALSPSQLESFYLVRIHTTFQLPPNVPLQWSYLSSLCYILITFLAKIASLHFFLCLSHPGPCTWFIRSVIGAVLLWTGIALFVVSFQCSLPRTWDMLQGEAKCINLVCSRIDVPKCRYQSDADPLLIGWILDRAWRRGYPDPNSSRIFPGLLTLQSPHRSPD